MNATTARLRPPLVLISALTFATGCGDGSGGGGGAGPVGPNPPAPDPRVAWLAANAVPFASISPSTESFGDLQPLKAIIGDSRVVMLGEQSHGDGATFEAKTRIIQFLHQEMGFDVLAWESGIYDLEKVDELIDAHGSTRRAAREGIFGVWSRSNEVQPLFDYVDRTRSTARPLEMAGFDPQFTGAASKTFLVNDLEAALRAEGSAIVDDAAWAEFRTVLQQLIMGEHAVNRPDAAAQGRFFAFANRVRADLLARAAHSARARFWAQVVESARAQADAVWSRLPGSVGDGGRRDAQMARNLVWLAGERYPNRKIIVWAATYHVIRNIQQVRREGGGYQGVTTMGDDVHAALGRGVYVLGFTAHGGSWGRFNAPAEPLGRPSSGSLEDLFARAGLQNALVDFRAPPAGGEWLRTELVSRPLNYAEMRADWTRVMDGMMFTRVMKPSTAIP